MQIRTRYIDLVGECYGVSDGSATHMASVYITLGRHIAVFFCRRASSVALFTLPAARALSFT